MDWETASEIDNLGFNLYRSTKKDGRYTKLNKSLIPGLISSPTGQSYTYADKNVIKGKLYYYKLEDIDLSGKKTMHGPVCVDWNGDGIPDDEQSKKARGLSAGGIFPPSYPGELDISHPMPRAAGSLHLRRNHSQPARKKIACSARVAEWL